MASISRRRLTHSLVEQPEIDLDETRKFLRALDPGAERWTFQTFDDRKNGEKDRRLGRVIHGTLDDLAEELCELNRKGAAVCVTMNETDFKGTKRENIVRVRALVADLDDAPVDAVDDCRLRPHIIVETSPGRHHVYWLSSSFVLDEFEDTQRAVAKRFDSDPAVALLTHRARLPGFLHQKADPFLVKIISRRAHDPFHADELLAEFPPEPKPHRPADSRVVLPAGAPLPAASEFIDRCYSKGDIPLLHTHRDAFYAWTGTHYRRLTDAELERDVYRFLNAAFAIGKDGKIAPYTPTRAKVAEVVHALRRGRLVEDRQPPFYLGERRDKSTEDLVACRNGILNLRTRELLPHDPLFFTTNCLPLDYDPNAPEPQRFRKFLEEVWPEDEEAEQTLQEVMGYLLTSDTRQQKIFLIVGPARGGKGTLTWVLEKLLGRDNVVSVTLKSLAGEFGRWPLIDKSLALIADARLGPRADAHAVAEHLLSISGGDMQAINRKHSSFWEGRLGVRFLITTNELPAIADASGTIATRFILLKLTESFLGREDLDLKKKLSPELPGILNWSLDGLDQLRKRGHFVQPKSSEAEIQILRDLASPLKAFVEQRCAVKPSLVVEKKTLWGAWRTWCEEEGMHPGTHINFGRQLKAAFPRVEPGKHHGQRAYKGIDLSDEGYEWYEKESTRRR